MLKSTCVGCCKGYEKIMVAMWCTFNQPCFGLLLPIKFTQKQVWRSNGKMVQETVLGASGQIMRASQEEGAPLVDCF
jgi:hypothetical protein